MAGPVGLGGSDFVGRKHLKLNWLFLVICIVVIGTVLYLWIR